MKKAILVLTLVTGVASAETVITPNGTYVVNQSGSTTWVTGPSNGTTIVAPVTVNPITGIGTVHTPNGTQTVVRGSSGTITVIGGKK